MCCCAQTLCEASSNDIQQEDRNYLCVADSVYNYIAVQSITQLRALKHKVL